MERDPSKIGERLAGVRSALERRFPERHIYMRSPAGVRGLVVTTAHQLILIALIFVAALWTLSATVTAGVEGWLSHDQRRIAVTQRLALLRAQEQREDHLIAAAETLAHARTERLRLILRAAGIEPATAGPAVRGDLGLIMGDQPAALAAALGIDQSLAARIQRAARAATEARDLAKTAEALPLAQPTASPATSSNFGMRRDPFTGRPAFHPGLDIRAAPMTPIFATAAGVVTFAGQRPGYGGAVEIDHGGGHMTRFAHLAAIAVKPGDRVVTGARLGAVGSTGRSTGPHLHYEIWRDGRVQDPGPYLRAGDYVRQAG